MRSQAQSLNTHSWIRRPLWIAVMIASATAAPVASAQPRDTPSTTMDEADIEFKKGNEAADAGDFETARKHLLKSFELDASYYTAGNLGHVELRLEMWADAAEHLAFALEHPIAPETRSSVARGLAQAKRHVATLTIEAKPEGAAIVIDNRSYGNAPLQREIYVLPGKHVLEVRYQGQSVKKDFEALQGRNQTLHIKMDPEEPTTGTSTVDTKPKRPHIVPIIVGGGVTLIGLGMGVGYTVKANNRSNDADSLLSSLGDGNTVCGAGTPHADDCDRVVELREEHDRARNTATWSFMLGGAAAAATLTYVLWPRPQRATAVRVAPTLNGVRVEGRF